MKRLLILVLLLCISFAAQAVDVTISLTPAMVNRAQKALGEQRNLKDGSGNPRDATGPELKQFLIDQARGMVLEWERSKALKAATDAVVIPPFDPT